LLSSPIYFQGRIHAPVRKLTKALYYPQEFMADNRNLIQFIYWESKCLDKKHLRSVLKMDYNNVLDFRRSLLEEVSGTIPIKVDPNFTCNISGWDD